MKKHILLVLLLFVTLHPLFAGIVQGRVLDSNKEAVPFASVYVKNTTTGTVSNLKGEYLLELPNGIHSLVFSFVGYQSQELEVTVTDHSKQVVDVTLKEDVQALGELQVFADNRDRAKEIMSEVRKKRPQYLKSVDWYQCETYIKTALDKKVKLSADSVTNDTQNLSYSADLNQFFKQENLNLIESLSTTYFDRPNRYKEVFQAFHDYSETKGNLGESVSFGIEVGEEDIAPAPEAISNPYIIYNDHLSCDFNFYENLINYPEITQKPLLSPLAETGALTYQFDLDGSFYEGSSLISKIKVSPVFITDAAFNGFIYVEDSTWIVRSLDLWVNPQAMHFCKDFHIIQNYETTANGAVVPVKREITYSIKEGSSYILGNTRVIHSDYVINEESAKIKWTNEVKAFVPDAFDKDAQFWVERRPIQMKENELNFIHVCDSLKAYFTSETYLTKSDSSFNHINGWSILTGLGRRNSFLKQEWYIEGALAQVQPFGIGGYRHKLPGYYNKEFKNDFKLETDGFVDYGFRNKDVKGSLGVGLTYIPKRFVRTYIKAGDYYDMINDYASVAQTFSRSNYVRNIDFSIAQRAELFNGFFVDLMFNYSDQRPINNLQLSHWSNELFGTLNVPVEFERYIKSEVVLEVKYRMKQKFMLKGNKKIILESKFPVFTAQYKKGFPGLFNSEVNYDYLELGASHALKLKRWGSSNWEVSYGTYLNKANLRVLEHKYFRGSDRFFFSNPVRSFQLLGPTLSTANDFFQANYMHHFEGSIMNKIPYLNRLKLELAGGIGILIIEDNNFRHAEVFAGLERTFKLWQQLIRVGAYAVTADNTLESADFTFKFGISFYNAFSRKWDY